MSHGLELDLNLMELISVRNSEKSTVQARVLDS